MCIRTDLIKAAFSEKLLVNNGVVISPIKNEDDSAGGALSMRDMVSQIDNERDFQTHITSHTSTVPPKPAEIRYEKHPVCKKEHPSWNLANQFDFNRH